MLTYILDKIENGIYYFLFYPEGNKAAPGRVAFYEDGTSDVLEESQDDFKHIYAGHALNGIDTEKTSGTVAWY